jgi:hypothetical protein
MSGDKEERHDAAFYYQEDKAAANIGRDDANVENIEDLQERFRQQSYEDDREQERLETEHDTERLYQLALQEGVITEEERDPQGYPVYYNRIWEYLERGGEVPTWEWEHNEGRDHLKKFYEDLQGIERRDKEGEWEKDYVIGSGKTIPKAISE